MNLQTNIAGLQEILETVNALPDVGSGGGSVETCTVTFVHEWGGEDNPSLCELTLAVPSYDSSTGSFSIIEEYMSAEADYAPQHTLQCSVLKNMPILVYVQSMSDERVYHNAVGGNIAIGKEQNADSASYIMSRYYRIYICVPTEDTATFTFGSP